MPFYRESRWLTAIYVVVPLGAIVLALLIPAITRWVT